MIFREVDSFQYTLRSFVPEHARMILRAKAEILSLRKPGSFDGPRRSYFVYQQYLRQDITHIIAF